MLKKQMDSWSSRMKPGFQPPPSPLAVAPLRRAPPIPNQSWQPWHSLPLKHKGRALRSILDLRKGETMGGRGNKAVWKGFLEKVISHLSSESWIAFSVHQEDKNCALMFLYPQCMAHCRCSINVWMTHND